MDPAESSPSRRQRLTREDRYRQLIQVAWSLVREEGTDALTLGRLAERSGVTKPVVYSHFTTRAGLLAALYGEFDTRQNALIDAALRQAPASLPERAAIIASSYVACVLAQGREIPGVTAALAGSPELESVKRECEKVFLEKCRTALAPFSGTAGIDMAGLRGMIGAAEALSFAAAAGEVQPEEAEHEIAETIIAMAKRRAARNR